MQVTLIGKGENEQSIRDLIAFYGVENIELQGHVEKGDEIWSAYHALILPSRFEGLPLVLLEAMAAGRTAIVTKAGGSDEVMDDESQGFLSQATEEDFEMAMERAWQRREEWEQLGINCFHAINTLCKRPAEKDLLEIINVELNGKSAKSIGDHTHL